jgi:carboxyl-terminal processing protease
MSNQQKIWMPLLLALALSAGILLGFLMAPSGNAQRFFTFEKPRPLQEVIDLIDSRYVDNVSWQQLSDTAIQAVLSRLDPHSQLIPAASLQFVNDDMAGKFSGIGIEFDIISDTVNVINIVPGGPADKAGLLIGDKIIRVNGADVAGKKLLPDDIRKRFRGERGSRADVVLVRNGKNITLSITRDVIPVNSIDAAYMITDSVGFLRIGKFTQQTYREFMAALQELNKSGMRALILDLRANGGGILDESIAVADEFLDGEKLVTYTEGKHFPRKEYRCKKPGLFEQGSLVVLIDEGSASASEILAGALQDWDRATIAGRRSFGKGLVQEQYDLSDGSALRLTIARYYTPLGRSIQRPYDQGGKAYFEEIAQRFDSSLGHANADSTSPVDTGKMYRTKKGHRLFGGGGIRPDIAIVPDTSGYSSVTASLLSNGTLSEMAYRYYVNHTVGMQAFISPEDFIRRHQFSESDWEQFFSDIKASGADPLKLGFAEKKLIGDRLQALVARQRWRNDGFYKLLNAHDNTVQKALDMLRNASSTPLP